MVLREKNGNVSSDLRVTLSEVMNMPEFKVIGLSCNTVWVVVKDLTQSFEM